MMKLPYACHPLIPLPDMPYITATTETESVSGRETDGSETIVCEDTDGDGINELGITISDETVYFKYTGEPWIEGQGGGCFERI